MATGNYTTISRTRMLEYLEQNSGRTVNVHDINHYLAENGYEVNVTTIYRYLDKLCKDGRVMKYVAENGTQAVYQYVEPSHHCDEHLHLQCVKCGAICHLDCSFMDEITKHVMADHGFSIQCKNSIIYGLCKKCGA